MKDDGFDKTRQYWNFMANSAGQAAAIDPNDCRGFKNAYISLCHHLALFPVLNRLQESALILDLGCGTGVFLASFQSVRPDVFGVGVDLSEAMLTEAVRLHPQLAGQVMAYDGHRLPFADGSVDALTCAGVLLYIHEDSRLLAMASEFRRLLKPGGWVVAVEQVRCKTHLQPEYHKVQRTPEQLVALFTQSGLVLQEWRQIRRGHFPLVYGIRYGWIPTRFHAAVARLEARLWRDASVPLLDYADALFIWRLPG